MVEYNPVNVKLSDLKLNKLKSAVKNSQGTTLRMNARIFSTNNLPHELFLTTRQTTKLRNAIENIMSTAIKLSKAQISKINKYGGFLGILLSKIPRPLTKVAVPIAKKGPSNFRINCCYVCNRWSNSKENTWFWSNNFNNFK